MRKLFLLCISLKFKKKIYVVCDGFFLGLVKLLIGGYVVIYYLNVTDFENLGEFFIVDFISFFRRVRMIFDFEKVLNVKLLLLFEFGILGNKCFFFIIFIGGKVIFFGCYGL